MGSTVNIHSFPILLLNSCLHSVYMAAHNAGTIVSLSSHLIKGKAEIVQCFQELRSQRLCIRAFVSINKWQKILTYIALSMQFSNQFATILQSVCSPLTRRSAESMSSLCSAKNSFKAGLLLEMRKVERRSLVNNTTSPVEYYSLPLTFGLLFSRPFHTQDLKIVTNQVASLWKPTWGV